MAELRRTNFDTPLSGPSTVRKYKHVLALDNSWHYDGPEIEMRVYASDHCFLYVGDSLFLISRLDVLAALKTKEWRRKRG